MRRKLAESFTVSRNIRIIISINMEFIILNIEFIISINNIQLILSTFESFCRENSYFINFQVLPSFLTGLKCGAII